MNGGPSDIAYENGLRDYEEISSRGIPIVYFSRPAPVTEGIWVRAGETSIWSIWPG